MKTSINFSPSPEIFQGRSATKIHLSVYESDMTLPGLDLIFECSLGSFVVNGQDTGQKKLSGSTNGVGEASILIAGPDVGGNGQLTVFFQESGNQIAIQPYHFKATASYSLNFNVINDYAMADGEQYNKVRATLTGTGSGVNLANRKLNLKVTGFASFEKGQLTQTTSVDTDPSGNVNFKLYNTHKEGENVTLTGFLDVSETAHATAPIHFQPNLDCDVSPPPEGKYIRTIFTYSINNQQYLLRQRKCDHLVTVHKLMAGGQQGEQTSTGQKWVNFYDLIFPFVLGEEQYIFGLAKNFINVAQGTNKSFWMIAKLDTNGNKTMIDHGFWDHSWDIGFAFPIKLSSTETKQFIYLHCREPDSAGEYRYIIREINQNGKMGSISDKKTTRYFIDNAIFFTGGDKVYLKIYYQDSNDDYYNRDYELNNDGFVGNKVYSHEFGELDFKTDISFSYFINNVGYDAGQNAIDNYFFVNKNYSNGIYSPETAITYISLDKYYPYMIPFKIDNHQYFIRQDQSENHWIIQEILAEGQLGSKTDFRG
ncbi:hypothetical protein [Xenorhabdus miraniensis]|uniref:Big-1 domain-containing protein n=1 Tax=Xenorhabdus miraniensis TaxID=351674 RepID=A0A2D0JMB4_9GAMM|nr:hypothetical protein [Xenorhabdus miraniensis]PHM47454.1 hypothetical protein Xmir_03196 [Xenorhabdus miraniensis]